MVACASLAAAAAAGRAAVAVAAAAAARAARAAAASRECYQVNLGGEVGKFGRRTAVPVGGGERVEKKGGSWKSAPY